MRTAGSALVFGSKKNIQLSYVANEKGKKFFCRLNAVHLNALKVVEIAYIITP